MSDSLGFALAVLFGGILPAGVALYAAYWAFTIRKALVSRIYRNQALWLGIFCLVYVTSSFARPFNNSQTTEEFLDIYYVLFFATVFAWVDSTIPVARRSDPLLRSVFHWEKLRFVVWAWVLGLGAALVYQGFVINFLKNLTQVYFILVTSYLLGPFVAAAPAAFIGARRSRDPVLRGSLKWFVVFLLMLILFNFTAVIEGPILGLTTAYDLFLSYPDLPIAVPITLAAYALYRSARSLAPTNPLSAIESPPTPSTKTATNI